MRIAYLNKDASRSEVSFQVTPEQPATLLIGAGKVSVNGRALAAVPVQASYTAEIGALHFVTPKTYRPEDFPMLRGKDVLKGIIERNEYK